MIGIYFLIKKSKIVYIGQSKSVENRIASHRRNKRIDFDSFRTIHCQCSRLLHYEKRLIKYFKPLHNGNPGGKRAGAGRPPKEKTIVMRVPISKIDAIKKIIGGK